MTTPYIVSTKVNHTSAMPQNHRLRHRSTMWVWWPLEGSVVGGDNNSWTVARDLLNQAEAHGGLLVAFVTIAGTGHRESWYVDDISEVRSILGQGYEAKL